MMEANGVGSLVVVNNHGELVGFLQSGKIIKRPKKSPAPLAKPTQNRKR